MKLFQGIYYSFPIQLGLLHIRKHLLLLLIWLGLFGYVTGSFGVKFGMHFLFLDAEYLDQVNFLSFLWVGMAFGFFMMCWHMATYILHSFRFHFLATLKSPFSTYCINNSLIPVAFICIYCWQIWKFQSTNEYATSESIFFLIEGFLAGVLAVILIVSLYFYLTNKNIFNLLQPEKKGKPLIRKSDLQWSDQPSSERALNVKYFVSLSFRPRVVRSVAHYSEKLVRDVFHQNHKNAFLVQLGTLILLVGLGFLIDTPIFKIPAAASILLVATLAMVLSGAFSYWLGGWSSFAFIILIFTLNYLSQFDALNYQNEAYGMNYDTEKAVYSRERLEILNSEEQIAADIEHTMEILKNWKEKVQDKYPTKKKPNMVILNASGGGLRSSIWVYEVLKELETAVGGQVLDHTFLMTGASGGMMTLPYIRELYLHQQMGDKIDLFAETHIQNLARDYVNTLAFSFVTNDIFYTNQTFERDGHVYRKDRGYAFENVYNEYTGFLLDKSIMSYQEAEYSQQIPLMWITPTILNDNRKLIISAQPVAYLSRPLDSQQKPIVEMEIDGMDFMQFFKEQDAHQLRLPTAIRMNASYPYVFPTTFMPSEPKMQIMDAGIRDNIGYEVTNRFLHAFRGWIKENVNKVIIIRIRDGFKLDVIEQESETAFSRIMGPISSAMSNWTQLQDFHGDYGTAATFHEYGDQLVVLPFEYEVMEDEKRASMAMHLTTKEKVEIKNSLKLPSNLSSKERLQKLFEK